MVALRRVVSEGQSVSTLKAFFDHHPRLASWVVLSVGMVILLLWATRGRDLAAGQLAWLAAATVGLAGACAWIIGWE